MEASALTPPVGISRARRSLGTPLLRLRSDEQLVALFRDGHDDAFRVIYDRYRQRLFAYTRQMLPGSRQDAEDALQDVFVRAYSGLRASDRELALRAWLYRVAHNRCIDEMRRPAPPAAEVLERLQPPSQDPMAEAEQRESLRQLLADLARLPDQQRSALLMRELEGMKYTDMAEALAVSIPAVKSLLVRARVSLAQAVEARDAACSAIRNELISAHDRGVRPSGMARRHMHDCDGCREFRGQMRTVSKQVAALVPALGPVGLFAKLLGIGGGAGGGAAAGSTAAAGSGAAAAAGSGGAVASAGALAGGASHVATLLAAAVVTAGGAVVIQHSTSSAPTHRAHHRAPLIAPAAVDATASGATDTTYIARPTAAPPPAAPNAASANATSSASAANSSGSATPSSGSAVPTHPDPSRLPGSPSQGPSRLSSDLAGSPGTGPTTPAGTGTGSDTSTPAAGATTGKPATGSVTGSSTTTTPTGTSTTSTTATTPTGSTATTASSSSPTGTTTTPTPQH